MEKKWSDLVKRVLMAAVVLCALLFLLCAGVAALIQGEVISIKGGALLCTILMELCVCIVCYLTAKKASHSRLPTAIAVAVVFLAVRLLLRQILDPAGEVGGYWRFLLTAAAALIGGCMAGMKKQRRR